MNLEYPKLITIVICTYNGAKNIIDVLEAILTQDGYNELVESIMVVDNCSTDNTKQLVLEMRNRCPIIKYVYESKPGLSNARRNAVLARTPWVAYLDDDNIILPGWLIELEKTIINNANVGVINGAVLPRTTCEYTKDHVNKLKSMYNNLACTHLSEKDLMEKNPRVKKPFGAGLCVLTKALQKVNDDGWLSLIGRQGDVLSSGEDGELSYKVLNQGYKYIFNKRMVMHHVIPINRLEDEYINKLIKGLAADSYVYISMKKNYFLQRLLRLIKYFLSNLYDLVAIHFVKDEVKRLKVKYRILAYNTVIKLIIKDKIIMR